jgi:hypothetical protein
MRTDSRLLPIYMLKTRQPQSFFPKSTSSHQLVVFPSPENKVPPQTLWTACSQANPAATPNHVCRECQVRTARIEVASGEKGRRTELLKEPKRKVELGPETPNSWSADQNAGWVFTPKPFCEDRAHSPVVPDPSKQITRKFVKPCWHGCPKMEKRCHPPRKQATTRLRRKDMGA